MGYFEPYRLWRTPPSRDRDARRSNAIIRKSPMNRLGQGKG